MGGFYEKFTQQIQFPNEIDLVRRSALLIRFRANILMFRRRFIIRKRNDAGLFYKVGFKALS